MGLEVPSRPDAGTRSRKRVLDRAFVSTQAPSTVSTGRATVPGWLMLGCTRHSTRSRGCSEEVKQPIRRTRLGSRRSFQPAKPPCGSREAGPRHSGFCTLSHSVQPYLAAVMHVKVEMEEKKKQLFRAECSTSSNPVFPGVSFASKQPQASSALGGDCPVACAFAGTACAAMPCETESVKVAAFALTSSCP